MVSFYKHDIPDWMDGTEALSDGAYRAYHVICQLIYLHEGPIMLNERGIAGRCNQSIKAFRKHLQELLDAGKLSLSEGRLSNVRATLELENVRKNRENAGKGGQISGQKRQNSGKGDIDDANPLKTNDPPQAALQEDRSLKEKRREEESRAANVEVSETSAQKPTLDDAALEAALRGASGLEGDPSPGLFVVGPIHALIAEGYDLDKHILPVLRSLRAKGKRWRTWSYVVDAVREQNAVRPVSGQPSPPAPTATPVSDEFWHQAVESYKRTRHWLFGRDSLPPDDPATTVPAHILAAHGYARVAA